MAPKIQHKRSAVAGKAPLPADLDYGEIGVNYEATDPALYIKDSADAIRKIGNQPDASETVKGIVELATAAETTTGTDNTRAVHPAGLKVELDKKANQATTYTKTETDTALALKANLASPALTGVPTAPTAAAGTNTTQVATTEFVTAAVAVENLWDRTGTVVSPTNSGDSLTVSGFSVSGASPANAVSVDANGRLLVGAVSSSVNAKAVLQGGAGDPSNIYLQRGDATPADGNSLGQIFFTDNAAGVGARISGQRDGGTWSATSKPTRVVFSTTADGSAAPVEQMRIDSSGRVGVGTTTPGGTLDIKSAAAIAPLIVQGPSSEFTRVDASGRLLVGTSTSVDSNAKLQTYASSGAAINHIESGSLANNNFAGCQIKAGSRIAQLAVYKHSGITNNCAFLYLQEENGANAYIWADNSGVLRISVTPTHVGTTSGTVVGAQTSDERLKNILGPVEYGLETLKQLDPVRYSLKSEPEAEKLGFIAQQVQPLIPQSVFDTNEHIEGEPEDAPTKLGMEYVALIPVLVNAIKELSAEVDALKAQLQVQ